jgi:hypothetical protein
MDLGGKGGQRGSKEIKILYIAAFPFTAFNFEFFLI